MKRRKHKPIFTSIVKQYMLSLFLMLVVALIIGLLVMMFMTKKMESGGGPKVVASSVVREDYENIDMKDISTIGGWVEILDNHLNVIHILGEKQDLQMHYTRDDMMNMLDITKSEHDEYHGTIEGFKRGHNTYYCVVKVPVKHVSVTYSYKNIPYEFLDAIFTPLILGLVMVVIAFIINTVIYGWWMSKKIIRPLRGLTQGIETITRGDYNLRLDFHSEREFLRIRDALNHMAETLQRTEREKRALEHSKMQLLADISHDIKTPMTTIQGYIRALKDHMIEESQREACYETIYRKTQRVDELMNDMFDYVKLEHVAYKLHVQTLDFPEFLRELIADYYKQIEDKHLDVKLSIPEYRMNYDFDPTLMKRAIGNVLENMIKYNPIGTRASIKLYKQEGMIYLEIEDEGIGIPEGASEQLFDPFVRGDKVRSSDGGSGLGLAITKQIIQMHGGSIEVQDGRSGKGTLFRIILISR